MSQNNANQKPLIDGDTSLERSVEELEEQYIQAFKDAFVGLEEDDNNHWLDQMDQNNVDQINEDGLQSWGEEFESELINYEAEPDLSEFDVDTTWTDVF